MQLDNDPKIAKQQLALAATGVLSFIFAAATVGLSKWYSPIVMMLPVFALMIYFVSRRPKKS